jgi:hypothetical protein
MKKDSKDHSVIIKIDGTSKQGGQRVLADTIESARRNTPGARGSFIIAPTRTLRERQDLRQLPAHDEQPSKRRNGATPPSDERCKATNNDGTRCRGRRTPGNYGYCNLHRY